MLVGTHRSDCQGQIGVRLRRGAGRSRSGILRLTQNERLTENPGNHKGRSTEDTDWPGMKVWVPIQGEEARGAGEPAEAKGTGTLSRRNLEGSVRAATSHNASLRSCSPLSLPIAQTRVCTRSRSSFLRGSGRRALCRPSSPPAPLQQPAYSCQGRHRGQAGRPEGEMRLLPAVPLLAPGRYPRQGLPASSSFSAARTKQSLEGPRGSAPLQGPEGGAPALGAPALSFLQLPAPPPPPCPRSALAVTQHLFKLLCEFSWLKCPTGLCP